MVKLAFASVWLLVFVIPWENLITFPGLGTLSQTVGILAIVSGLISIVVGQKEIRFHPFHWAMVALVFLTGLSIFWSFNQEESIKRFFTYVQMLGLTWLIFQLAVNSKAVHSLLGAYVLGATVSLGNLVMNFVAMKGDEWQRFSAQGFNPNDMAIIFALGIPMAWYLAEVRERGLLAWVFRLYPVAALFGILLTASRNGILAAVLTLSYPLFTLVRRLNLRKVIFAALALGMLVWGSSWIPQGAFDRIATFDEALTGGMNSRTAIWSAGLQAFSERPFLGYGGGAFHTAIEPIFGGPVSPHNIYLSFLVDTGLVGFLIFATIIGIGFACLLQMPKRERWLWIALLGTFYLCAAALNWEWRKQTWLILVMVVTHAAALSRASAAREEISECSA